MFRSLTTFAFLLLLSILILAAPPAPGDEEGDTKKADDALQKLINDAIERGAGHLARQQQPDGSFPAVYASAYPMGSTALPLLALLHSGVDRKSPVVVRALGMMKKVYAAQAGRWGHRVYSVSVAIMALAEYGRSGRAGFSLERADLEWMQEMVAWLIAKQQPNGVWRYPEGGYDHSCSQYALLALKEARRSGLPVSGTVFANALAHFLSAQEKNGPKVRRHREKGGDGVYAADLETVAGYDRARGWGYVEPDPATGAMTAAGVASVAICAGELTGNRWGSILARAEQAVFDGLAWLGRRFSVTENPPAGVGWHYYYLYGLERAGVLAGVVYMGGNRWYAKGAKYLVDAQQPDGGWRSAMLGGRLDPVEQSFALLFLSRATARGIGVATEAPLLDLSSAGSLGDEEFDKLLLAALEEMNRLGEVERKDRARDFALMGPRVLPLLIRDLAASAEDRRGRAILVLEAVTGKTFGYEASGAAAKREEALDRWMAWYLESRSTLELDRETGLIR